MQVAPYPPIALPTPRKGGLPLLWRGLGEVLLSFLFIATVHAQKTPLEIKYKAWGLHALRHYPFDQKADDIVNRLIAHDSSGFFAPKPYHFHKSSLDLVVNTRWMAEWPHPATPVDAVFSRYILKYYGSWLKHGRPVDNKATCLDLTLFLSQTFKNNCQKTDSTSHIFNFIDSDNLSCLLSEWTGDIDLSKNRSEVLTLSVKSPLAENAMETYQYCLSGMEEIDGVPAYTVAFFSKKRIDNTFEGYLYVSAKDFSLLKAVFTLNRFARRKGVDEMLFTHTPSKKENLFYLGNDSKACLLLNRTEIRSDRMGDSLPLTASEQEISALIEEASRTRAYRNLQKAGLLLATSKIGIFNDRLEIGSLTHTVHYNELEGLRLRIGGNTTWKLNRHVSAGGYLAYGFKDKHLKYRGDLRYSYHRNDQFHFTYVHDLNLPGYDLLADERDQFFYSFSHSGTKNMPLQKIGRANYEKKFLRDFSAELTAKYIYEELLGQIHSDRMQSQMHAIKNAELGLSLRYAPHEKFVKLRDDRLIFQDADFDLSLNYRMGIKGIFGSRYNYKITGFSIYKKIYFPSHTSHTGIRLSGGKVWGRVPFPILFIPGGNQGYIFQKEDYNLMNYYEFVTDRYLAGKLDFTFNWSPVKIIHSKSKLRTNLGLRTVYGPLSDNNNPQIHPELFIFNNGIRGLGTDPYTEISIGLDNILKIFRIDYVQRLHDKNQKSIFFAVSLGI
ncbi:MAG: hypothetical protein LBG45_11975 [Dysgonamonadaceae bacterium]|nr:hypothetical protein [Dysgonamonadaceae bacterium]